MSLQKMMPLMIIIALMVLGAAFMPLILGSLVSFLLFVLFILDDINLTIMEKNERKERDEIEAESYT